MTTCSATQPWPCETEIAGGTSPLGAVLCARHLAGILAPARDPLTVEQRLALRVRHPMARSGGDTAVRDDTNAPTAIMLTEIRALSTYDGTLRMPVGATSGRAEVLAHDDARIARSARAAVKQALASGFAVRVTLIETNLLVKAHRDGARFALSFEEGRFEFAWLVENRDLSRLGYRECLGRIKNYATGRSSAPNERLATFPQ